jgi:hypothetical protein
MGLSALGNGAEKPEARFFTGASDMRPGERSGFSSDSRNER